MIGAHAALRLKNPYLFLLLHSRFGELVLVLSVGFLMSCFIACLRRTVRDTHGLVTLTRLAAWTASRLHVSKISLHAACVVQPALSGKLAMSGLQDADA